MEDDMRALTLAAGLLAATPVAAETPVLTVYTYDSFVTEWGPGPAVEAAFEATCGCDLRFVAAGDGAALLARLRLEGARTEADVVLGLDTNLTAAAEATGLFAPHGVEGAALDLPVAWDDPVFLPFDWGYFAFVHDREALPNPPRSFRELADSDVSILIQDPRSSTPGLGLLLWVKAAYGDEAPAIWAALADNIVTVTKGWSEAYGLFLLEGEADMVLSYTTSPAYHLIAEDDPTKAAAAFEEGHYMQVEVAGAIAGSDQPDLARDFLTFMLSDAFQSVIPTTNWMYPAVTPEAGLPAGFETLHVPRTALLYPADEAQAARDEALAEWLAALSN
jgi:thiamine transport system substrate-binding protein